MKTQMPIVRAIRSDISRMQERTATNGKEENKSLRASSSVIKSTPNTKKYFVLHLNTTTEYS